MERRKSMGGGGEASGGRGRDGRDGERGAILVVVLLIMVVLLGLGVMGMWLAGGNLQVAGSMSQRQQALYVAEAGLERAAAHLNNAAAINIGALLVGSNPAYDNVPTGLDAAGKPNGVGALLVDGGDLLRNVSFPPASFARGAGTAEAPVAGTMGTYTVWIRNDTAEARQGLLTSDSNRTVVVRSQGLAADGRTSVVLEAVMTAAGASSPGGAAPIALCYSGKDGCDENSSSPPVQAERSK
jgi:hypothetical protein